MGRGGGSRDAQRGGDDGGDLVHLAWPVTVAYRPLNTGGRFSVNARWPSW